MRKREGKAGARGGLRVNGYIEHINPHVMSNICVPGGRSSGWNGEGVARHTQTQDSISQELCIVRFCVCMRKQINRNWSDVSKHSYFFYDVSFIVFIVFRLTPNCAAAALLTKEISDLNENNVDKQRWNWKKQKPRTKGAICFFLNCHVAADWITILIMCYCVINVFIVMKQISFRLKSCVRWGRNSNEGRHFGAKCPSML